MGGIRSSSIHVWGRHCVECNFSRWSNVSYHPTWSITLWAKAQDGRSTIELPDRTRVPHIVMRQNISTVCVRSFKLLLICRKSKLFWRISRNLMSCVPYARSWPFQYWSYILCDINTPDLIQKGWLIYSTNRTRSGNFSFVLSFARIKPTLKTITAAQDNHSRRWGNLSPRKPWRTLLTLTLNLTLNLKPEPPKQWRKLEARRRKLKFLPTCRSNITRKHDTHNTHTHIHTEFIVSVSQSDLITLQLAQRGLGPP